MVKQARKKPAGKTPAKPTARPGKGKAKPATKARQAKKSSAATAAKMAVKPGLCVMTRLDGKVAVVSAAAQGIGRGIAMQLAQSGTVRTASRLCHPAPPDAGTML